MSRIGEEVQRLYGSELEPVRKGPKRAPWDRSEINTLIAGAIALTIILVASVYYYNRFAFYQHQCYAQQAQMEKEFQRRADLIPALIDVAGDYAKHEQRLFQHVANTHSLLQSMKGMAPSATAVKRPAFEKALAGLIALAEQYPDLKATQSYQDLMEKLETTEDRIASSRDAYVRSVRQYNTLRATFPSSIFNLFFRYEKMPYYKAVNSLPPRVVREGLGGGSK